MLSVEDNEFLTSTRPGTPMGRFLRRHWVPFLLASELPTPDCPPVRVRLMSEDLVAFRDTAGRIGLVQAACPHRRAGLFWGRNEDHGLRCVYHGWKFDVDGNCVDMPSEPESSDFQGKVHITSYPCREKGSVIWAYLGPVELVPELPSLEWTVLPDDQRYITKVSERANWVQGMEGGIDSAHSNFLHTTVDAFTLTPTYMEQALASDNLRARYHALDRSPRFYVRDTDYGMLICAQRNGESDSFYWRVTHWLMPFYNLFGGWGSDGSTRIGRGLMWCPIDDQHTHVFSVTWSADRPLDDRDLAMAKDFNGPTTPGTFVTVANIDNDYLIDRESQRAGSFTGVDHTQVQDLMVQESMGSVVDRSLEHLGTSDTAIIRMRKLLQEAAIGLMEGTEPHQAREPSVYRVQAVDALLPREDGFDAEALSRLAKLDR